MGTSCRTVVPLLAMLVATWGCDALDQLSDPSESEKTHSPVFDTSPDVGACVPGTLTDAYEQGFVERLNQIRLLHQLPPVTLASAERASAQAAALAIVANAKVSHGLGSGAFCYTSEAARSSSESLLFMSAGNQVGDIGNPDRFLGDWLRDVDVGNLGHRRWLLDPFLAEVAFGLVQGEPRVSFPYSPVVGAALDVKDDREIDLSHWVNDFVAHPYGEYPSTFFDKSWLLSFSVVVDKTQRLGSVDRVAFESASVVLTDPSGAGLTVTDVQGRYDLMGLPNVLTWRVSGLEDGVKYDVRIAGVTVDGVPRDYEYELVLVP